MLETELVFGTEVDDKRKTFFNLLFGLERGLVCLAYINPLSKKFSESFFNFPEDMPLILKTINENLESNVYFCPQLFNNRKRTKENVESTPNVWADLDNCGPEKMLIEPSIVLESSDGRFQAFWILGDMFDPDDVENLAKRIAYKHAEQGADKSGWDLTQLLRVPYTYNHKYKDPPVVKPIVANRNSYSLDDFEADYPPVSNFVKVSIPLPKIPDTLNADNLLQAKRMKLNPMIWGLYSEIPEEGKWSQVLWKLLLLLFENGFTREEAYVIAQSSACNKYARDGRPAQQLWKDTVRAETKVQLRGQLLVDNGTETANLTLMSEDERKLVNAADPTFLENYIEWAGSLGDAAIQYHQAGALVALASMICGSVRLPTSFGTIVPNIWFMILADTSQPYSAKIATPNGWSTMEKMQIGDFVIGSDGYPTKVIGINERGVIDTYEVLFNDGSKVECSADHLWTSRVDTSLHIQTVTTSRLIKALDKGYKPRIPISAPIQFEEKLLPISPYILGAWLAEGCRSTYLAEFSTNESEFADLINDDLPLGYELVRAGIREAWYVTTVPTKYGPNPNPITTELKNLNLLNIYSTDRWIPKNYRLGSVEQRIALLQGLMDGDGTTNSTGNCRYSTTSLKLAKDVLDLVRSLGSKASMNTANRKTVTGKTAYTINFSPSNYIPFRLSRKADKINISYPRISWKSIIKINKIEAKQQKCILISNVDGLYVTDDCVLTHNTITRKTTAMDIAMDLIEGIDDDVVMATDGSIEGLLTSLSMRSNRPSIFLRDEFAGLLEQMAKKDYMSGMAEMFTKLYDGKMQKRVLRKEVIEVRNPRLIIFAGGIKTNVCASMTLEHIGSGFIPRFIFITAESDVTKLKPVGPPTQSNITAKEKISGELLRIYEHYNRTEDIFIESTKSHLSQKKMYDAEMTEEAWLRYNQLETKLVDFGINSNRKEIYTPIGDRLAKSILKSAILISASRQFTNEVLVEELDILRAIKYGEQWFAHTQSIVNRVGLGASERLINRILERLKGKNDGLAKSYIMQNFKLSARDYIQIMETLEQRGQIVRTKYNRGENIRLSIEGELNLV